MLVPHPTPRACYAAMISFVDKQVGRLMALLKELDLEEDTILLFINDNGQTEGLDVFNAGMRGKKCWAYEGGHRNGCFIHWPGGGLAEGRDIGRLTAHVDLLPTILDHVGLGEVEVAGSPGRSLEPMLHDREGRLLVNFVGRFENLQADFNRVCGKLGLQEPALPHRNKSDKKSRDTRRRERSLPPCGRHRRTRCRSATRR